MQNRSPQRCRALLAAAMVVVSAESAQADFVNWDNGGGDALWGTGSNWSTNFVPNSSDDLNFPFTIPGSASTITVTGTRFAKSLAFQNNYTITGGSLDLSLPTLFNVSSNRTAFIDTALVSSSTSTVNGAVFIGGPGKVVFGGANNFVGRLSLLGGTLEVSDDSALGAANSQLELGGTLSIAGSFATSRTMVLINSNARIDVAAGQTFTMNTPFYPTPAPHNHGVIAFKGAGTLVATGGWSWRDGATTIENGTVRVDAANAIGFGPVTLANSGTLELNGNSMSAPLTMGNGTRLRGSGTATWSGAITPSGTVYLASGTSTSDKLIISTYPNTSAITEFSGSGRVVLNASSGGQFQVMSGILTLKNETGAGGFAIVVNNGGTLELGNGAPTLARVVTLNNGAALSADGAATTGSGVSVASGAAVTLGSSLTTALTLTASVNALSGGMSGSTINVVSAPSGKVVINQASTYSGAWTIAPASTLEVNDNDRLGNISNPVTISTSGTLRATETFTSARTITSNDGSIDVPSGKSLTLSAVLGSGSGSLTKNGLGNLTLTSTQLSSRTGVTNINAGTLTIANSGRPHGTGAITVFDGATLEMNSFQPNPINLNGGATLRSNGSSATGLVTIANSASVTMRNVTVSNTGMAGGTGSTIVVGGVGSTLNTVTINRSTTYAGAWNVVDHTLQARHADALGTGTSAVEVTNGALELANNITLNRAVTLHHLGRLQSSLNTTFAGVVTLDAGATTHINGPSGTSSSIFTIGDSPNDLTGGGPGTVLRTSSTIGWLLLAQSSDVVASWDISGKIRFSNENQFGPASNAVTLNTNGFLESTVSQTVSRALTPAGGTLSSGAAGNVLTLTAALPATGTFRSAGSGTIELAAAQARTGTTEVNGGTLKTIAATASKFGPLTVITGAGAKLDVNNGGLVLPGASVASVRSLILSGAGGAGFGSQTWDQPGIMSASAAADPLTYAVGYIDNDNFILGAKGTFDGVSVPPASIPVKSTLAGDADLDWDVDDDDVTVLGIFYGQPGHWYEADFDYTGVVDDDDVTIMGITYGQSLPASAAGVAIVPEPGGLTLLAAALATRRRRRSR